MNIKYCYEKCDIGQTASDKFLKLSNSVIDAAIDFNFFTENCFKTCPYTQEHTKKTRSLKNEIYCK